MNKCYRWLHIKLHSNSLIVLSQLILKYQHKFQNKAANPKVIQKWTQWLLFWSNDLKPEFSFICVSLFVCLFSCLLIFYFTKPFGSGREKCPFLTVPWQEQYRHWIRVGLRCSESFWRHSESVEKWVHSTYCVPVWTKLNVKYLFLHRL